MAITVEVNGSHSSSMHGVREEFAAREVFFGNKKTDITNIIDKRFCARVGVNDQAEEPSLWFGKVLAVRLGHGLELQTTIGDFRHLGGRWMSTLRNGTTGVETQFEFEK